MTSKATILIILFTGLIINADTNKITELEQMVITATATKKQIMQVPYLLDIVSASQIQTTEMSETVPEALQYIPGIMVQKTATGHGSPYIRGFTSRNNLFMIDNVKLNNSCFRSGPNEYWNTVDPFSLSGIEVMKGTAGALYGSDAIGGVVNALTVNPRYSDSDEGLYDYGRAYIRAASADSSFIGRAEGGMSENNWGIIAGVTTKNFNDLRAGGSTGKQPKTGYEEVDYDIKFAIDLSPSQSITMLHQNVNQDDVWRTHKTIYGISWEGTDIGSEDYRYQDHNRTLSYIRYQANDLKLDSEFTATVSYQQADQNTWKMKNEKSENSWFGCDTTGIQLKLNSYTDYGLLTIGTDYYHDNVDSSKTTYSGDQFNGGTFLSEAIQGDVADDSAYDTFDVYLQDDIAVIEDFIDVIAGIRYSYVYADIGKTDLGGTGVEGSFSDNWDKFTGNLRTIIYLDDSKLSNVYAGISQGFRAPNIMDLSGLISARTDEFNVPQPEDIKAENFLSYEIGGHLSYGNLFGQAAIYYTDIDGAMVSTFSGEYTDDDEKIMEMSNDSDGYVWGFEVALGYNILENLLLHGDIAWIDGKQDIYNSLTDQIESDTMSRLMPLTVHVGLRWDITQKIWLSTLVTHMNKADDISLSDQADTQRIPEGGTPAWTRLDVKGGMTFDKNIEFSVGCENIADVDYRIHGSGNNEAGINFIAALNITSW
ncbi:MAG: TonB-dependent receptor [Kiritimatiellae bacterium]|jgi:hemoglobin/transferrin/lactoferrin receptor protein|nr:TonB-dependent receptor [Kiritimatiellia bacterium]